MPLTHDFNEAIRARAQRDVKFRQALRREAVEHCLNGGVETGNAVLRKLSISAIEGNTGGAPAAENPPSRRDA